MTAPTERGLQKARELLPCPFCGGEASIPEWTASGDWEVQCSVCKVHTSHSRRIEPAIEAWNRRADARGEWPSEEQMLMEKIRLLSLAHANNDKYNLGLGECLKWYETGLDNVFNWLRARLGGEAT